MSATSHIEWTDATWNPTVGCTKVSPGCDHCYAETLVNRFAGKNKGFPNRFDVMTVRDDRTLKLPLRWRKPRRIFVNSLSDLFHQDVPDEFIACVFAVMAAAPQHTFQLLTKRHARMRSLLNSEEFDLLVADTWSTLDTRAGALDESQTPPWPLPNVWLGVTVENQQWAGIRIPALLGTRAAVRFLSCEPLLGPVDLIRSINVYPFAAYHFTPGGIDWVICGGESGPGARPMHPDWARTLRDQCQATGVPFHFKQWGEWAPGGAEHDGSRNAVVARVDGQYFFPASRLWTERPHTDEENRRQWAFVHRAGKRAAGRDLDGRTWDEYPQAVAA